MWKQRVYHNLLMLTLQSRYILHSTRVGTWLAFRRNLLPPSSVSSNQIRMQIPSKRRPHVLQNILKNWIDYQQWRRNVMRT